MPITNLYEIRGNVFSLMAKLFIVCDTLHKVRMTVKAIDYKLGANVATTTLENLQNGMDQCKIAKWNALDLKNAITKFHRYQFHNLREECVQLATTVGNAVEQLKRYVDNIPTLTVAGEYNYSTKYLNEDIATCREKIEEVREKLTRVKEYFNL
jgi:hypothetical protein